MSSSQETSRASGPDTPADIPAVRTVLCSSEILGGHTLSAAEFRDGRFGLYLDSDIGQAEFWESGQLDDCINAYLARRWACRIKGEFIPHV